MKTKNQRWWDVPAAIFLFGALLSAALRLHMTNWTEHLGQVEFIVILGALFGFALGKSIFSGRTVFFMGLAYTLFVVPWQLGLLTADMEWGARLELLYARLWYATADFLANKPVRDSILFIATMYVLYWFAGLLSTYQFVRRANPWFPLLALGGMILVIEYSMEMYRYARIAGGTYSFLFLVFCLLLMGRLYYLRSKSEWEERGGTVEMEVGYDLGRGVAVAAIVIGLIAWNTPRIIDLFDSSNPGQERVSAGWQSFRERMSLVVDSLRSPSPMIVEGYGSNMFLGTGGELSESVFLNIKPSTGQQSNRLYWTGRTYDMYETGQWASTISDAQPIGPGQQQIPYPEWELRKNVTFTFSSRIPLLKTLYYAANPLNLSREAQAIVSIASDGSADLNAVVLDPPLKAGEEYNILASIPQPTILALRESGEEYPEWVTERYLQLPENFSPMIEDLAQQVAGDEPTAYDKAVAVTQYLRRTITYSETVPEPPRDQDPIEWFLFDQRSGFCNYYASAEILMLRSLGVPARMSVGYAQGTWDPETNMYVVLGKDSHAWPEVYFPTLGWIVFEPTVSQPLTEFPLGETNESEGFQSPGPQALEPTFDPLSMLNQMQNGEDFVMPERTFMDRIAQYGTTIWVSAIVLLVLVLVLLVVFAWRRGVVDLPFPSWIEKTLDERGFRTPNWLRLWSRRSLRTPMESLFATISFMLRVWGQKMDPAYTPAEQVAVLVTVVPGVKDHAFTLLDEYQRAMYSQYPPDLTRAREAVRELRTIGYRNWVMRLVGFES